MDQRFSLDRELGKLAIRHIARALGTVLIFGTLSWSNGAAGDDDEARQRAEGAAVAEELCSGCHIVAEGQTGPVPDGVPPFPVIAGRPGRTSGYLRAFLSDPTPPMPHVPLSQRQIESVITYIRSFAD